VIFPAAQNIATAAAEERMPALLYDDPARTVEELLFHSGVEREWSADGATHRLFAVQDATKVNIICTELQQKRLILADGSQSWERALAASIASTNPPEPEHKLLSDSVHPHGYLHLSPERPEDAVAAVLLNEEDEGLQFEPVHRVVRNVAHSDRFADRARLLFHVEHLPGSVSEERVTYLLQHGNELGTAMVAVVAGQAYLMKVRTDVLEAMMPGTNVSVPDIIVLQLFLERLLETEFGGTEPVASLGCALRESRNGAAVFCLNPITLAQVQHAALRMQPVPADTFRLACAPPVDCWKAG
jgi:Protein of unknown function (DUF1015)